MPYNHDQCGSSINLWGGLHIREERLGGKLWGVVVAASASWEVFIGGITARLGAGGGGT